MAAARASGAALAAAAGAHAVEMDAVVEAGLAEVDEVGGGDRHRLRHPAPQNPTLVSARRERRRRSTAQATHSSAVKLPMLVLNVAVTRPAAAAMWRTGAAVRRCAEILERPNIVVTTRLVVGKRA